VAAITTSKLIDDLDGSDAEVTVTLTVDSNRYVVDLNKINYNEYVAPLIKVARTSKVGRPSKTTSKPRNPKRAANGPAARGATAYSKLASSDQSALRTYLRRSRGRISDREVREWKSAARP
jgi:hypothetical protein